MAPAIATPRKLWQHPNPKSTEMWKFMQTSNRKRGLNMQTFRELYAWSIGDRRTEFWEDLWDGSGLIYEGSYTHVVDASAHMDSIPHWFEGTYLNFAENILFAASPSNPSIQTTKHKEDSKIALTEVREGNTEVRHLSWGDLRRRVGLLANAMRAKGVKKGDRVAVVASHSIDTFVCFMAAVSLGGLFSSSSTDMGTQGILERLLQIKPAYVFVDDWTIYNGKTIDLRPKIQQIVEGLEGVSEFKGIVSQPRFPGKPADVNNISKTVTLQSFLEAANGDTGLKFERVAFRDPFLVVYSSGTTGVPKCIVHSTGGVLVNFAKEGKLHGELGPDSVKLQYTTTGWIMYLVSLQCCLFGTRSVLYDGSPFNPSPQAFLSILEEQRVTDFGTSPRFLQELQKLSIVPKKQFDLSALRSVTTTGMVLPDSVSEWFYDTGFPSTVFLKNISGGTDLAGCFGTANPLEPLYLGGCMGPSLGIKLEVYDSTIESGPGRALPHGEPGELVATASFPNQPVFFWGDESGERYYNAYYTRFPHVWTHGDFIEVHPVTGQVFFLGRADGVLNPSGVRFGSAEIYSVIEENFPEVADSICVGQRRPEDNDESVLLFLKMNDGFQYSQDLADRVKSKIGQERSRRHAPRYVFQTWDIPTTINGKKVELPVKQIVSGKAIKASGTLANPDSLSYYYQFAKMEEVLQEQNGVKEKRRRSKL
ncbi:acetoacetate-CoA ligase [Dothidotthia symphoricarpi CBS 119687]|uniref:Acetoacetate-CoA ligase n=1 Tax=Dothidotthia symphoricarpi CBS 119687 TaxID=1392245 RepID=A0A6A6A2M6_9PLEO|nr:acetoacetate-CoA ligase [Dothidotthia symphoricarpi CBS 119687]KAF2125424.1 acetoacetate-CoA ligase [Dothidotthia symphoricarpi CBS 119687]